MHLFYQFFHDFDLETCSMSTKLKWSLGLIEVQLSEKFHWNICKIATRMVGEQKRNRQTDTPTNRHTCNRAKLIAILISKKLVSIPFRSGQMLNTKALRECWEFCMYSMHSKNLKIPRLRCKRYTCKDWRSNFVNR